MKINNNYSNIITQNNNTISSLRKELNDLVNDNLSNKKNLRTLNVLIEKIDKDLIDLKNLIEVLNEKEQFNSVYTNADSSYKNNKLDITNADSSYKNNKLDITNSID